MPEVVIDGIVYVPKTDIPPLTDTALQRALEMLTEIQYFSECRHKHRAWAWDALNALAPDLAALSAQSAEAAYNAVHRDTD